VKVNSLFRSKYLRACDLDDGEMVLTIRDVEMCDDFDVAKPVMHFDEIEQGLVLNKTNCRTIASLFRSETDGWTGQHIALFVAQVVFRDQVTDAIRVRAVRQKATASAKKKADSPALLDDAIPY
jgi:hypothetical protein